MRKIDHFTSIDGKKLRTDLNVADDLAGYLEVIKAEEGCGDEAAEAILCKHILDSRKLERNAKVRGPIAKRMQLNRGHVLVYVKRDPELKAAYVEAMGGPMEDAFLDKVEQERKSVIPGWVDLFAK